MWISCQSRFFIYWCITCCYCIMYLLWHWRYWSKMLLHIMWQQFGWNFKFKSFFTLSMMSLTISHLRRIIIITIKYKHKCLFVMQVMLILLCGPKKKKCLGRKNSTKLWIVGICIRKSHSVFCKLHPSRSMQQMVHMTKF